MDDAQTLLYSERNLIAQLAAHLAQQLGYQVWLAHDADAPDWPLLYIKLPTGQIAWHIAPADFLWPDYPRNAEPWDGHDTPEKLRRITTFVSAHTIDAATTAQAALVAAVGDLDALLTERPMWPTVALHLAWVRVRSAYQHVASSAQASPPREETA